MIDAGSLRIKVFADGADLQGILGLAADARVNGFTTNPTLMRQAGVANYEQFARDILYHVRDRPVSLEVLSDDLDGMERQAQRIAGWAKNVYVKIPVTNTAGQSTTKLVHRLSSDGVKLNVTAVLTLGQVRTAVDALECTEGAIVSVFAGRIADTGRDPVPVMAAALELVRINPLVELLWASPREVLNAVQANAIGCDIITMTHDLLKKLRTLGRDLNEFSLETVKMFRDDAVRAGYDL
jgi:transaldolase